MKQPARSVRIFLADGSATGLRHLEVDNWSGQCVVCPRTLAPQLKDWKETQRPGVYWLFGEGDDDRPVAYVGEAENVLKRLANHLSNKDFWREVVIFTSKDTNLTKAHIKYLEARFVELALAAGRYEVKNGNTPTGALLPRADAAAMEGFLSHARLLLTTTGHRVLDPLSSEPVRGQGTDESPVFSLKYKDLDARGQLTEEGMMVLAGSQGSVETTASFGPKRRELRDILIEQGLLVRDGSVFVLQRPYTFTSPTAAACVLSGSLRNGRRLWRTEDGTQLGDWEEEAARNLEAASDEDT